MFTKCISFNTVSAKSDSLTTHIISISCLAVRKTAFVVIPLSRELIRYFFLLVQYMIDMLLFVKLQRDNI